MSRAFRACQAVLGRDTTRLRTRAIERPRDRPLRRGAIGSVAVEAIRRAPEACSLCWRVGTQ